MVPSSPKQLGAHRHAPCGWPGTSVRRSGALRRPALRMRPPLYPQHNVSHTWLGAGSDHDAITWGAARPGRSGDPVAPVHLIGAQKKANSTLALA